MGRTVAALRGDAARAARLRGYVDAWYRREGCERDATERRTADILTSALREKLAEGDLCALDAEGEIFRRSGRRTKRSRFKSSVDRASRGLIVFLGYALRERGRLPRRAGVAAETPGTVY